MGHNARSVDKPSTSIRAPPLRDRLYYELQAYNNAQAPIIALQNRPPTSPSTSGKRRAPERPNRVVKRKSRGGVQTRSKVVTLRYRKQPMSRELGDVIDKSPRREEAHTSTSVSSLWIDTLLALAGPENPKSTGRARKALAVC